MDILGILDPNPHENLCGSETLLYSSAYFIFNVESPNNVPIWQNTGNSDPQDLHFYFRSDPLYNDLTILINRNNNTQYRYVLRYFGHLKNNYVHIEEQDPEPHHPVFEDPDPHHNDPGPHD